MKKSLLIASVAACVATSANAVEFKPYVGLDYVYSMTDLDVKIANADVSEYLEDDLNAFAVSVGAKLHKNFGVEAFYQQSEDGEKKWPGEKTTTNYKAYGVDFVGYFPAHEKIELLGSVGVGYYDAEAKYNGDAFAALNINSVKLDDSGLGYRLGVGAQYNFTENWGARVMARYVDTDIDGMDNMVDLTAGVRYTF